MTHKERGNSEQRRWDSHEYHDEVVESVKGNVVGGDEVEKEFAVSIKSIFFPSLRIQTVQR